MPKKKTCLIPKEDIKQSFDNYLDGWIKIIKMIGHDLIDQGIIAEDPFQHIMLAVSKMEQNPKEDDQPPPGTFYN